jgi:sulfide dehydrogenase cytochrome subunit
LNVLARALALAALAGTLPASAQDRIAARPEFARNQAAACASCHAARDTGAGGLPVLVGKPRAYLAQTLKDFRDGRRSGTLMPQLARGYDDTQIEAIAAWYSGEGRP